MLKKIVEFVKKKIFNKLSFFLSYSYCDVSWLVVFWGVGRRGGEEGWGWVGGEKWEYSMLWNQRQQDCDCKLVSILGNNGCWRNGKYVKCPILYEPGCTNVRRSHTSGIVK